MISCILPTRGRSALAIRAVRCLAAQTFTDWELIVLDDEAQPSFESSEAVAALVLGHPVFYMRHVLRNIAAKRNVCAANALGDAICHWDSDDWSAPGRLADQVERLRTSGKAVTGYHSMYFVEPATGKAYWYQNDASYALGTSLVYRTDWWVEHPFQAPEDHPSWGEDNLFVTEARDAKELLSVSAEHQMVARLHPDNSCKKEIRADIVSYTPMDMKRIPAGARA